MNTDSQPGIAYQSHDHGHCIDEAMRNASDLCHRRGVRLTPIRKQVLKLIWSSHKPLGAYALLDMLAHQNPEQRRPAPPTVYRALDFLLEQGLVHRIASLNAFIGCHHPGSNHLSQFLICSGCTTTLELCGDLGDKADEIANEQGFQVAKAMIELTGLCPNCQQLEAGSKRAGQ